MSPIWRPTRVTGYRLRPSRRRATWWRRSPAPRSRADRLASLSGVAKLRLIQGSADQHPEPPSAFDVPIEDAPSDEEALDAYSRAVSGVARALAPSVTSLRVQRRGRRGWVQA